MVEVDAAVQDKARQTGQGKRQAIGLTAKDVRAAEDVILDKAAPPPADAMALDTMATDTPASDDRASQLVEPGRALALADFGPPSLGTGERLMRLAYRLGVPGQALTVASVTVAVRKLCLSKLLAP